MGYSTTFYGVLRTSSPIPPAVAANMRDLAEADTRDLRDRRSYPGFHCDFVPTRQNDGIQWTGSEKTYDAVEWVNFLIDEYLKPAGITIPDGEHLDAQGEEHGDVWRLEIRNGRAVKVKARLVFDPAE